MGTNISFWIHSHITILSPAWQSISQFVITSPFSSSKMMSGLKWSPVGVLFTDVCVQTWVDVSWGGSVVWVCIFVCFCFLSWRGLTAYSLRTLPPLSPLLTCPSIPRLCLHIWPFSPSSSMLALFFALSALDCLSQHAQGTQHSSSECGFHWQLHAEHHSSVFLRRNKLVPKTCVPVAAVWNAIFSSLSTKIYSIYIYIYIYIYIWKKRTTTKQRTKSHSLNLVIRVDKYQ